MSAVPAILKPWLAAMARSTRIDVVLPFPGPPATIKLRVCIWWLAWRYASSFDLPNSHTRFCSRNDSRGWFWPCIMLLAFQTSWTQSDAGLHSSWIDGIPVIPALCNALTTGVIIVSRLSLMCFIIFLSSCSCNLVYRAGGSSKRARALWTMAWFRQP